MLIQQALIGSSFAPLIGAAFTQFTSPGWRAAQYFVAGMAALAMGLTYFVLPETMHAPIPHDTLKQERGKKFVPYVFNPLAILGLFCWPNICAITFVSSATMLMAYIALVPISSAFVSGPLEYEDLADSTGRPVRDHSEHSEHGLESLADQKDPILIGCIFISSGIGNIVGSRIAGREFDFQVSFSALTLQRWQMPQYASTSRRGGIADLKIGYALRSLDLA
jgi:MFS family permease